MWSRALSVLVIALAVAGCRTTPHRAYRAEEPSRELQNGARVLFVELNEQGRFFPGADGQFDDLITRLDAAGADPDGAVVVLFVHGWRNDASPRNERRGNLASFERLLSSLAEQDPLRPVIGVYLAWRGDAFVALPPLRRFDFLFDVGTFWSRKRAASRLATRPNATQVLLTVFSEVRQNPNSRVIAIGHSMGGLILERSLYQALTKEILEARYARPLGGTVDIEPPADLVVFVNSATAALEAQPVIEMMEDYRVEYVHGDRPARPVLLSLTSESDRATGLLFPIGLKLGTLRQRFSPSSQRPGERFLARHTLGHTEALHTHEELGYEAAAGPCSEPTADEPIRLCPRAPGDTATELAFSVGARRYTLRRRSDTLNHSSYWALRTPAEVIDGHSGIFRPELIDFLRGLIVVTDIQTGPTSLQMIVPAEGEGGGERP